MLAIETTGLCRRFKGGEGLREASLKVPEGSAFALIGANGAGKTTLLRLLVNILQPASGSALVLGKDSRALAPADFNRIGYLAENQKLPARLSIEHFFAYLSRLYPRWDARLAQRLLDGFELPANRQIGKLSHGMRMKVMLIGSLGFRPQLLLLDEPLTGLDPLTRDEVVDGLIGQADNTTIVISSHEMSEVEGLATHVAYMDKGHLIFQQPTEDLLARFRNVTATLKSAPDKIDDLPPGWLFSSSFERTIKFTERAFIDEFALKAAITSRFGPVEQFDVQAMSLRDVSKALMSASRKERGQ